MFRRSIPLLLAAVTLSLFVMQPAFAQEKSHEGVVVSAGAGKLTMTMADGNKKHTHEVPATAKITVDGKPAKLEELKENFHIKVTTDDKNMVKSVEGHSKR